MAYQIAFDTYESATQQFISRVLQSLRLKVSVPIPVSGAATTSAMTTGDDQKSVSIAASATSEPMEIDKSVTVTEE